MQEKLILLTRDQENSRHTAGLFALKGRECFVSPLCEIKQKTVKNLKSLVRNKHVIITSYNAIWQFMDNPSILEDCKNIFAVGERSEKFLEKNGLPFHKFVSGQELYDFLQEDFAEESASFLYLRGRDVSVDFANMLEEKNYDYNEEITYYIEYKQKLSAELIEKIKLSKITHHISFSKINAENFIKLLKEHNILSEALEIRIAALSSNIAEIFYAAGFKNISASDEPKLEDVLELCLASL